MYKSAQCSLLPLHPHTPNSSTFPATNTREMTAAHPQMPSAGMRNSSHGLEPDTLRKGGRGTVLQLWRAGRSPADSCNLQTLARCDTAHALAGARRRKQKHFALFCMFKITPPPLPPRPRLPHVCTNQTCSSGLFVLHV